MNAYMPKTLSNDSPIGLQYHAYKRFVELGGLTVTDSMEEEAKVVLSEQESYGHFQQYYAKHTSPPRPFKLCDKLDCVEFYKTVGISTLPQVLLTSESDFDSFLDIPVLLKPRLSGGGISSNHLAYTIFDTGRALLDKIREVQPDFFEYNRSVIERNDPFEQLILQQAVAKSSETFGQLYTEGFVNGKGEVFFSSAHEIGFKNCRWTEQIELGPTDSQQIIEVKDSLTRLVSSIKMKNTMFLLQWVRNLNTGKWYPTDWQYRLSYNSLWGRQHFEENYCRDLVKYMTDQVPAVTAQSKKFYFQKYFVIDVTKSKQNLINSMKEHDVIYAPFGKSIHESVDKFLFIASGNTFAQAKSNMEQFERQV